MITVSEVKSKKDQRLFLNFPLKLYKNNPCFVPPLYGDEKKLFRPDYEYYEQAEAVYFLARRDGKCVGRISAILHHTANEKWKQKRVRFTRFDCIDDQEAANALFKAAEDWARARGMEEIVGPLGFSDMEREGLLIWGFDQLCTFEEQYNYEYYQRLVENYGFRTEVEWSERQLRAPSKEVCERLEQGSAAALKRYGLRFGESKNTRDFVKRYGDAFFRIIDQTYSEIYGSVPIPEKMKKVMIANFKLIINKHFVVVILDKDGNPVCFGLCFPSIGKPLQKSGGHLYPLTLLKLLHAIRHPKVVDLALIGVIPEYRNKGVSSAIFAKLVRALVDGKLEYAETNLTLETNYNILNQWKNFDATLNKRRRSYVKTIGEADKPQE